MESKAKGKIMIEVLKEHHTKKKSEINRQKIIDFFKENPGESMKECQRQTGLSYVTVRKHVKEIISDEKEFCPVSGPVRTD